MTGSALNRRIAGIELGGTKSIAVLSVDGAIVARTRCATTAPVQTLAALAAAVAGWQRDAPLAAVGIGSFGPLSLDTTAADFGHITRTPKPSWSGVDVRGGILGDFAGAVGFDTDVAGAALAEGRWGAARECSDYLYMTIGTGIGVGVVAGGRIVHGSGHPEVGHLRIRRRTGDGFAGTCPFHGDCLEGVASGPALAARTGVAGDAIPRDHPVWADVAAEIGEALAMLILTLAPERIVVGGGVVGRRPELLPRIAAATGTALAAYLPDYTPQRLGAMIVPPGLGDDAGPLGAVALGEDALGGAR